jgi:hypothetical protein
MIVRSYVLGLGHGVRMHCSELGISKGPGALLVIYRDILISIQ